MYMNGGEQRELVFGLAFSSSLPVRLVFVP
jgi:hypothetical protein